MKSRSSAAVRTRSAAEDLELLCLELAFGDVPTRDTESRLHTCEPNEIIEIPWRAGLLTAQAGQDGRLLGSHQVQHLNLADARRFRVHEMFHASLGIDGRRG